MYNHELASYDKPIGYLLAKTNKKSNLVDIYFVFFKMLSLLYFFFFKTYFSLRKYVLVEFLWVLCHPIIIFNKAFCMDNFLSRLLSGLE